MHKRSLFIIIVYSFIYLNNIYPQDSENKILEYRNTKDEFTLVVIKDNTSQKVTKQKGIKRAAQLARQNGYGSFDIIKENEVEVMLGKNNWPSAYDFPQNLYQEEIIERGYNRERIISGSKKDYKLRKALNMRIKCYFNSKGTYKVCDIIKCF